MDRSKIHDDKGKAPGKGQWIPSQNKTGIGISHGYCPECLENEKKRVDGQFLEN